MATESPEVESKPRSERRGWFKRTRAPSPAGQVTGMETDKVGKTRPIKWNMGMLNDKYTNEVPGSVLLLSGRRNEPLGLQNAPARTSSSSLHSRSSRHFDSKKKTPDGAIILEPQPDDSHNDPLNWPSWRRDVALLSLGCYCMVGGGITPVLAAGFNNVAETFDTSESHVALTTGLYMMGLGIGSVIASPTAILYGKRPVYLMGAILFIATSCWCAASPSFNSLLVARIFQGISLSPIECLPSATIAEIFFLHERAWRIGIYTLLLLSGKNLVPLVSAAVIQSLGWRWVFWIVAMIGALCWVLLFLFVPETFWDRTPHPKSRRNSDSGGHSLFDRLRPHSHHQSRTSNLHLPQNADPEKAASPPMSPQIGTPTLSPRATTPTLSQVGTPTAHIKPALASAPRDHHEHHVAFAGSSEESIEATRIAAMTLQAPDYFPPQVTTDMPVFDETPADSTVEGAPAMQRPGMGPRYTSVLRTRPPQTFIQQLKPWNGRLHSDNWLKVAIRPFVLYSYPAVLWSSIVYACSIGWLIVLSESVSIIYRSSDTYNFSALSAGLVYISPFIGGVLGTAVAGRLSDVLVRFLARRNGGLYEPEFRLLMAAPVAVTTVIGLMGYGWSAQERDNWIVPTIFFGVISFGCSLGSTTSITFCVDSYRQYAGEALVTLNFTKNIFHGLVFSLFFNSWLDEDGSRIVFVALGIIQLGLLCFTIPMYIYGKRARMWTVRKNFMEKF